MKQELTERIIGAAIEVHRTMGPGLLESIYEDCLALEFAERRLRFERQKPIMVRYKGRRVATDLKVDLLVEQEIIVELKSVDHLLPVHEAQLLTYLRLTNRHVGLLINFNVTLLRDGLRRMVNNYNDLCASASLR